MSERITTAEELDALPVGVVMRTRTGDLCETGTIGHGSTERVVWAEGWLDHAAAIEHLAPLTVLYRPDAPVTAGATVTREQVQTAIGDAATPFQVGFGVVSIDKAVDAMCTALGLTVADGPTEDGA